MSRRTVLTVLTALGTLGAAALPVTAGAQPSRRAPAVHSGGRRVAILGGGMAGPAAHELIERGFEVTVFEPTALGGKARSIPSPPGTAAGGRLDLHGTGAIDENDIASWFLDPGVKWGAGGVTNDTRCSSTPRGRSRTGPRHTPRSRTCSSRATTSANDIDLATMESANESARAAVGALLQTAGSPAAPPALYKLHEPPELEPLRRINADRYRAGQPHMLA